MSAERITRIPSAPSTPSPAPIAELSLRSGVYQVITLSKQKRPPILGLWGCYFAGVIRSTEEVESTTGYHSLHSPGVPRTVEKTVSDTAEQLRLACRGIESCIEEHQTATDTKFFNTGYRLFSRSRRRSMLSVENSLGVRAFRRSAGAEEKLLSEMKAPVLEWAKGLSRPLFNSLFTVEGLDPDRDSPVESLHTPSVLDQTSIHGLSTT